MGYTLKKNETVEVNGLSIRNVGLQTIHRADFDMQQISVVLFIQRQNESGKEFSTIIKSVPEKAYQINPGYYDRTRVITAYDNEITITYADPSISNDIEFTVVKKTK